MNITKSILKAGDAGVEQTIKLMKKYADEYAGNPQIKKLVSDIEKVMDSQNEFSSDCKRKFKLIEYLYIYVIHNIRYELDPPNIELVKSPKHTILGNSKYGDCDDLSVALATLLKCAGFECWYRVVAWKKGKGDDFTHVFLMVELPCKSKVMPLDPSMRPGGFGNMVNYFRKKDYKV
jgi:hypothetical protein